MFKLKNREEFEGGLKNRKNLKKPEIKVPNNREEFRQGGGQFFWLARIYTPAVNFNVFFVEVGEGMGSYMAYRVSTKTNLSYFKKKNAEVNRRFSDFLGELNVDQFVILSSSILSVYNIVD